MKCIPVFLLSAAAVFAQTFATGQAARLVIGQTTFTTQDTNSSDTILGSAGGLAYAADTLFVADSNRIGAVPINHRVLLFGNLSSQLPLPTAELQYNRKCPVCLGQASVVLGQPDFVTTTQNNAATANSLRLPTAVASDGVHLVVADTDHNRVLIWNHIPTNNNAPADVVVGQKDFVSAGLPANPNASSVRGPQGVWIQNGKLYIADTQNNRVLVYNRIPTTNGAAADLVLGAPDFTTFVNPDITQQKTSATANSMLNPVAVTSDGVRLLVTDLGFNRVLIFNTIPTTNGAAADVAIGQPDLVSSIANNAFSGTAATSSTDTTNKEVAVLCPDTNGKDLAGNPTYPNACNATVNFPRFALSAGGRLFIADGGNDRLLVYEKIPTSSGVKADTIIGQIGGGVNQASDDADSLRTPTSLAWDGANLYVSDTFNRRIMVYTIGATTVGYQGIRNAASLNITAHGTLIVAGTIQAGDLITVTINTATYTYTVLKADTLESVVLGLVSAINTANSNAGDPYVIASPDPTTTTVLLTSKQPGDLGNGVTYSVTFAPPTGTTAATIQVTAGGSALTGGGDAARLAPGTVVSVLGSNLSAGTANADPVQNQLPTKLGGTQVYFNGIPAPLFFVSPNQVNAQIPWELGDTTSINAYVRSEMADGSIMFTSAAAAKIVPANPGLYFQGGTENPQQALIFHASSNATAIVSVDGGVGPGSVAVITVNGRSYSYTSSALDTLDIVRDALIGQLNTDPQVTASAAGVFDRIILKARIAGPEGNGIPISGSAIGGSLVVTAIDQVTCCGNIAGAPVTKSNRALPGELVILYATGLGLPFLTDAVQPLVQTGVKFPVGGPNTVPQEFVSANAGGSTADVLSATMLPGTVGGYQILLHLNAGLVTSDTTLADIAQNTFISNQVAFPLLNPGFTSSQDPVLLLVMSHPADFTQGQQSAYYNIAVTNTGSYNPTAGPVKVTATLPDGLTLVTMVGDGWSCTANICTRSDALGKGNSWPAITLIVNVAANAASSVVTSARITGGSSSSSSFTDTTVVTTAATTTPSKLSIAKTHTGNFTKGQPGATYTLTVSNAAGAKSTAGTVIVNELFPTGLTLVSMSGVGWQCTADSCTRVDALSAGGSYPVISVTVNVDSKAPASVTNKAIVYGGGSGASIASDATTIN